MTFSMTTCRADIVISSTSAPHCVIAKLVRKAWLKSRAAPVDIAVPRDIECRAGDLGNVYLTTLRPSGAENLPSAESVDGAWKIVKEGAVEVVSVFEGADLVGS